MKEVIAPEVAEAEIDKWCERFGVTVSSADSVRIVSAIIHGRLSLDEDKEEFVYRLRRPVALDNGKTIDELRVHEPTAGQTRDANKNGKGNEIDTSLRLLASITEQPLGVIERIGLYDLTLAGALFNFFV